MFTPAGLTALCKLRIAIYPQSLLGFSKKVGKTRNQRATFKNLMHHSPVKKSSQQPSNTLAIKLELEVQFGCPTVEGEEKTKLIRQSVIRKFSYSKAKSARIVLHSWTIPSAAGLSVMWRSRNLAGMLEDAGWVSGSGLSSEQSLQHLPQVLHPGPLSANNNGTGNNNHNINLNNSRLMEWLAMLETAHLSLKKPHGTIEDQRQGSTAKWFGLSSNYWGTSVQLRNSSKDKLWKNAKRPPTTTKFLVLIPKQQYSGPKQTYSSFHQRMTTLGWCEQTSRTLWLNEHPSSLTSHSESSGGPLVLIKSRTLNTTLAQPQSSSISCQTTCLLGGF